MAINSNQKSSQNTAKKSQNTNSSQKMKVSKSYVANMQANASIKQNLNNSYYKERLAEQREITKNAQKT